MTTKTPKIRRAPLRVRKLLSQPYTRVLIPEADGTFSAEILEFAGCSATGRTPSAAYANLERCAERWLRSWLAKGNPAPRLLVNQNTSGRFALRLPRSLYQRASQAAALESVSLNQFISNAVAERVGATAAALGLAQSNVAKDNVAQSNVAQSNVDAA